VKRLLISILLVIVLIALPVACDNDDNVINDNLSTDQVDPTITNILRTQQPSPANDGTPEQQRSGDRGDPAYP
jgi:hypothetical protein